MNQDIKLLDVVALLKAKPKEKLMAGQVGTVVEILGQNDFEVEFANKKGQTIALLTLKKEDFLVLHYEMELA